MGLLSFNSGGTILQQGTSGISKGINLTKYFPIYESKKKFKNFLKF